MKILTVPKALRDKLGEDGSDSLVELLNESGDTQKEDMMVLVEQKFEIRLSEETSKLDKRITEESFRLDKRITEECSKLDKKITVESGKLDKRITEEISKVSEKIATSKSDIIKWMFIFWLGQVTVILGILFVFFKKP